MNTQELTTGRGMRAARKALFAVALAGGACMAGAADAPIFLGGGNAFTQDVPAGETVTRTGLLAIGDGVVYKTGAGTWRIPLNTLMPSASSKIVVCEGQIDIVEGGTLPDVPEPAWLRARAALWLSARTDEAQIVADDAGRVTAWYDVRETDRAAPHYMYGLPIDDFNRGGAPVRDAFDGQPSVSFGGYGSGIALRFMDTNGEQHAASDVLHYYVVHGVRKNVGVLAGTSVAWSSALAMGGEAPYFPVNWNEDNTNRAGVAYYSSGSGVPDTRFSCNGTICSGQTTVPRAGAWEVAGFNRLAKAECIDALFRECLTSTQPPHRSGGDAVGEVLLFTQRLTEAERVELEAYLMRKWGVWSPLRPTIEVAEAAQTIVSVDAGETAFLPAGAAGAGTLMKTGAGTLVDHPASGWARSGLAIALREGTLRTRALAPLRAEGGRCVTVEKTPTCADNVATVAAANAGTFVKDGAEDAEVAAIAPDVARLRVARGRLRVTGGDAAAADWAPVPPVAVPLVNAGFETPPVDAMDGAWFCDNGTDEASLPGWRVVARSQVTWMRADTTRERSGVFCGRPPEGMAFMALRQGAEVSQQVELPFAGRYELTLWTTGQASLYRQVFDLLLLDESAEDGTVVTNSFGSVLAMANGYYTPVKGTCDVPRAGTYRLVIATNPAWPIVSGLDDVRLVHRPAGALRRRLVPNGDFERGAWENENAFSAANACDGWAFDSPDGWARSYPAVGRLGDNMLRVKDVHAPDGRDNLKDGSGANPLFQLRRLPDGGGASLAFLTSGVARTTFTPEKGTWKLKAVCAAYYLEDGASDVLEARVTVGGVTVSLGTLTAFDCLALPAARVWPQAFTADGKTPVTLELAFSPKALGQLTVDDDLELCEAAADDLRELLADGGFERRRTNDANKHTFADWNYWMEDRATPVWTAWGEDGQRRYDEIPDYVKERWEGDGYAAVAAGCHLEQTFTAAAAGVYRLRFAACRRADYFDRYSEGGGLALEVAVLRLDGETPVTNFTATVDDMNRSNFVARAYDFRLPAAGAYTLSFTSVNPEGVPEGALWQLYNFIDGASLTRAPSPAKAAPIPAATEVEIAAGAQLELAFPGTNEVARVCLDGRSRLGVLDAANCPGFLAGPGALFVRPRGTAVILR